MPTRLQLEGPDIELLLARIRAEHGPTARIVSADKVRKGGVAGFFAKEQYAVEVEVDDPAEPGAKQDAAESPADAASMEETFARLVAEAELREQFDLEASPADQEPPPVVDVRQQSESATDSLNRQAKKPHLGASRAYQTFDSAAQTAAQTSLGGASVAGEKLPSPTFAPDSDQPDSDALDFDAPDSASPDADQATSEQVLADQIDQDLPQLSGEVADTSDMATAARSAEPTSGADTPASSARFAEILAKLTAAGMGEPAPRPFEMAPTPPVHDQVPQHQVPQHQVPDEPVAAEADPSTRADADSERAELLQLITTSPAAESLGIKGLPAVTGSRSRQERPVDRASEGELADGELAPSSVDAKPTHAQPAAPPAPEPVAMTPETPQPTALKPPAPKPAAPKPARQGIVPDPRPRPTAASARSTVVPQTVPAWSAGPAAAAHLNSRLGIPAHYLQPHQQLEVPAGAEDLLRAIASFPPAPLPPQRSGQILVLVGEGPRLLTIARAIAAEMDVDARSIVSLSDQTGASSATQRAQADVDVLKGHLARTRGDHRPTVIALEASLSSAAETWARTLIAAIRPTQVWAMVDATRKTSDTEDHLAAFGGVDALLVEHAAMTRDPAAVLALGVPVARLDGRRATRSEWTTLLGRRLFGPDE